MSDEYVPTGPACDFCEEWPAVGTLMNLSDYQTTKFCANHGPAFLLSIVEAMTGAAPAEPAADNQMPPCWSCGQPSVAILESDTHGTIPHCAEHPPAILHRAEIQPDGPAADGAPADGAEHWAGTTHVVKSTHGHRGGKTAGKGDPE